MLSQPPCLLYNYVKVCHGLIAMSHKDICKSVARHAGAPLYDHFDCHICTCDLDPEHRARC